MILSKIRKIQKSWHKKISIKKREKIKINNRNKILWILSIQKELYFSPIKVLLITLKNLTLLKSPIHKLKVVVKCSQLITESVKYFYTQNTIRFSQLLESDDLMSIIPFILSKTQVANLGAQLYFIESFLTPKALTSISGYHLTNFIAAFNFIKDMDLTMNKIP